MKKFLLLVVALTGLYSCGKEAQEPQPQSEEGVRLNFTAQIEDETLKALDTNVGGDTQKPLVSFRGSNTVKAWIYIVDKNGLVVKTQKELKVSDNGKQLSYEGIVAPEGTTIDNATAKISVYVGLGNDGRFNNKGFRGVLNFGSQSTSLPENYVVLKSENNPLTYVPRSLSGKQHEYKTSGKLNFKMSGHLFVIRFRNEFNPRRKAARVNEMRLYNLYVNQAEVQVSGGKTKLERNNTLSSGFEYIPTAYQNAYKYPLAQEVTYPAVKSTLQVKDPFGTKEQVVLFYVPTFERIRKDIAHPENDGDRYFAIGYRLANLSDYSYEADNEILDPETTQRVAFIREGDLKHFEGAQAKEGLVHRVLIIITGKVIGHGGGRN
jgi:lipoprotein